MSQAKWLPQDDGMSKAKTPSRDIRTFVYNAKGLDPKLEYLRYATTLSVLRLTQSSLYKETGILKYTQQTINSFYMFVSDYTF